LIEYEFEDSLLLLLLLYIIDMVFPRSPSLEDHELTAWVEFLPFIPCFKHNDSSREGLEDFLMEAMHEILLADFHSFFELSVLRIAH